METIEIAADEAGIRQAAVELLEEAMDAPERERIRQHAAMAANAERMLAELPQRRTLSPGYYDWVRYLIEEVEFRVDRGLAASATLDAKDVLGLRALHKARAEFQEKHPACRGCGKNLPDASARYCRDCEHARWEAEMRARR